MKKLLLRILERLLGGPIIVLADDESVLVLTDEGTPSRAYLATPESDDDDCTLGAVLTLALFTAVKDERGKLLVALESVPAAREILK